MWMYRQANGALWRQSEDGERVESVLAAGYSGFGEGKNNPALQRVENVGPIPRGYWTIGPPECVAAAGPHGRYVLRLTPIPGTATHGRDGFLIHGDSVDHPGAASHGCIVLPRPIRERIVASGDTALRVIV